MKKQYLSARFELGITFIPFLIIILLCGYYKLFFTYFLITFIHEMSHVIAAVIFKVKVNRVKLNIFGFNAEIDNIDYLSFYKQLIIILAGPCSFVISFFLLEKLYAYEIISLLTYYKALSANKYILFFNLLPIYPLDGGRIIKIILDKLFTYKSSRKILYSISFIFMILFVFYTMKCKQYLMYIFLIINFIINVMHLDKEWKRFLINRYYLKNNYKEKIHNKNDFYMYKCNFLIKNKEILDEKKAIVKFLKE